MSLALSGKQILSPSHRSRNLYRTKAYHSEVDETLFGSPSRYCQQKDTPRVLPEEVTWDPPWVTSPTKTGAPILWTPFDSKETRQEVNSTHTTPRHENRTPNSARNKYRPRKQTPSYVDETLFGSPIKEPSFKAPWNADNDDSYVHCQVTWSPPLPVSPRVDMKEQRKQTKKEHQKSQASSDHTPVIKPRQGSSINTPQSKITLRYSNGDMVDCDIDSKAQQKLNFERNEDDSEKSDDPDAIVERALKLAGIYSRTRSSRHRSNSLGSLTNGAVSPGGYFWRRPTSAASSTGSRKERASTPSQRSRQVCSPNIKRNMDDLFSATGTKVELTPRSTPRGRPNSARSEVSMGSVPGLDLSKPPRMYGHQRPSSARSARSQMSRQSPRTPLSSRPSWRP